VPSVFPLVSSRIDAGTVSALPAGATSLSGNPAGKAVSKGAMLTPELPIRRGETMFCPVCLTEYRNGFFECAACGVALVAERPSKAPEDHTLRLVTVLEADHTVALLLATSSLEEAGIDCVVAGEAQRNPLDFRETPGIGAAPLGECSCRILVAPEREAEARELLAPLQSSRGVFENHRDPDR
jgi:hypothetical protein